MDDKEKERSRQRMRQVQRKKRPQQKLRKVVRIFLVNKEAACMLSLTIAGGIFLLDYKIKEHIDSTRLQGSKEEALLAERRGRACAASGTQKGRKLFRVEMLMLLLLVL